LKVNKPGLNQFEMKRQKEKYLYRYRRNTDTSYFGQFRNHIFFVEKKSV
jgi:hypothetical protein